MMNRGKWIWLLMILMLSVTVCFAGCGGGDDEMIQEPAEVLTVPETQVPAETAGYQPPAYTEAEIQAAMDVAKAKFDGDFPDCQLLRMEYIEGKYLSDYAYYAKRCAVDRVIVLESDYVTDPDVSPSLNANHTYHNWKWILIDDGSGWSVWTSGYG